MTIVRDIAPFAPRHRRLAALAFFFVLSLLLAEAGASDDAPSTVPQPAAEDVSMTLFLIGDAGDPDPDGEPVLHALSRQLAESPATDVVVFLGDNVYPAGMPTETSKGRPEMERRIDAQMDAVRGSADDVIFLPGNHDWAKGGDQGWQRVLMQEQYVTAHGGPNIRWLPPGGHPGPSVADVGDLLRLVVIDSQWFLHDGPKPVDPESNPGVIDDFRAALDDALAGGGDRVVAVVSHHPIVSTGPHGGHFGIRDHLFPLTRLDSKLWVPLPVLGSIYVIAREQGTNEQDVSSSAYERMNELIGGAMAEHPPLLHAAGHHHALEVYAGDEAALYLVSGAGIYGHLYPSSRTDQTLYNASKSGFMRLDIMNDRSTRLEVVTVNEDGEPFEAFSMYPPGGAPQSAMQRAAP